MGNTNGTPQAQSPFPARWAAGADPTGVATIYEALQAISALAPDVFLAANAPIPELEDVAWDAQWQPGGEYMACAKNAVSMDIGLNRLSYRLVPKKIDESQFWRRYYCLAYMLVQDTLTSLGSSVMPLSKALLEKGDDVTSTSIIAAFESDPRFDSFAKKETEGILARDAEDDEKLAEGIRLAVSKGVVELNPPLEKVCRMNVAGKSADTVAAEIVRQLGDAPSRGVVLVLQGLSGTGKGTTVAKLAELLPRCSCWSNGNVFRAMTVLALDQCERLGIQFNSTVLTVEFCEGLVGCLKFIKVAGQFDIRINGCGHDLLVSQVANTLLKEPRVGKAIPTVAKAMQGEVIKFAAAAATMMRDDGMNVLMEGRAQTLNYVRTPHRFELVLDDPNIIGQRRAAQRMMAAAVAALQNRQVTPSTEEVRAALEDSLITLCIPK